MNQRERQRYETRKALSDAALELFSGRGFDATTVEEIAARAGVSARTFFLHFPTKAAAAFPDHDVRLAMFVEALQAIPADPDPLARIIDVLHQTLDSGSASRRRRYRLLASVEELRAEDARTDRDYEQAMYRFLIGSWGESTEAKLRARATANAIVGVLRAALVSWAEDGVDPAEAAYHLLIRMFGVPMSRPLQEL